MSGSNINWKGVVFWILLIVLLAFVILFIFDLFNFKATVARFTSLIGIPKLGNINLSSVTDFFKNNATLIGIATPLGITALTYFIKNYQTNKLLDQKIAEISETKLNLTSQANSKTAELQRQIDELNSDTTADSLQKSLLDSKSEVNTWMTKYNESQKTITRLQEQIEARPIVKFVEVK